GGAHRILTAHALATPVPRSGGDLTATAAGLKQPSPVLLVIGIYLPAGSLRASGKSQMARIMISASVGTIQIKRLSDSVSPNSRRPHPSSKTRRDMISFK